ncbi:MAG: envelope stress response membrane protein PspC [Thermodesulfobacteriota bacterium]
MRHFHHRRAGHFRRWSERRWPGGGRGLYRSRRGVLLGVCRGLADYFDFSVTWIRILAVAAFVFTGFWPAAILYLVMGLIMKPAPVTPPRSEAEEEFYHSYADSRSLALGRLKRTYEHLERRLRRMEDVVTSRDFDWDSRARG